MTEGERLRELENRLWQSADQFRANSTLSASQYSTPVLGLIFLRYADVRFTQAERELEGKASSRREIGRADFQALGVMYLPETARFSYLRSLPEGGDIGAAVNRAMEVIEEENPDLKGVLPHDYARFDSSLLAELIRLIGSIPDDIEGDALGKIYEYFLPKPPMRLGLRWVVESTNSWLSNYGQLRRNTDRKTIHRHAQLCLVAALIITIKLIDWRNRWSPDSRPIR